MAGWDEAVVGRLAADLRAEFPEMRDFSADNLWRRRQFFAEYSNVVFLEQAVQEIISPSGAITHARQRKMREQHDQESENLAADTDSAKLAQAVRELAATVPWGHHVELLKKSGRTSRRRNISPSSSRRSKNPLKAGDVPEFPCQKTLTNGRHVSLRHWAALCCLP
jgi:hypothetical protein